MKKEPVMARISFLQINHQKSKKQGNDFHLAE